MSRITCPHCSTDAERCTHDGTDTSDTDIEDAPTDGGRGQSVAAAQSTQRDVDLLATGAGAILLTAIAFRWLIPLLPSPRLVELLMERGWVQPAIVCLAAWTEKGDERYCADELLRVRPAAVPHVDLIRFADQLLARDNRLVEALRVALQARDQSSRA